MSGADGEGYVLCVDVETTGHDDERDTRASLLEVGAILCHNVTDLPDLASASMLIRPPGSQLDHDAIWSAMPQVVRDMHTASGLWLEATTAASEAWTAAEADAALTAWVNHLAGPHAPVALAGAGVSYYDHLWLRAHLPQLRRRLTYWTLDASVIRRALENARRPDLVDLPGDVDAKPHRGLADAQLHLRELRRYLRLLATIPPADRGEQ